MDVASTAEFLLPGSLAAVGADDWSAQMLVRTEVLCRSGSFEIHLPTGRLVLSTGLRLLLGLPVRAEGGTHELDQLDWVPPEERDYVSVIWRSAAPDEPFEFEHRVVCRDGSKRVVLHRGVLHAGGADSTPGAERRRTSRSSARPRPACSRRGCTTR
jgi:PAS domain-containing protein